SENRGARTDSPAAAADGARVIFICVRGDDEVRAVTFGPNGLFKAVAPGAVLVDHTTGSEILAREMAAIAHGRGFGVIDAPLAGGAANARQGSLVIMAGGLAEHFSTVEPLLGLYARLVRHVGPSGSGQLMKMANQICITGMIQAIAEALAFVDRHDLDRTNALDVLRGGSAHSRQLDMRGNAMLTGDYRGTGTSSLLLKDLTVALDVARARGLFLPVAEIVAGLFKRLEAAGHGESDAASLISLLTSRAS
ncbi:MAG: NAD(P)-dependent oxidoreductase, partial [Alphaproteobacteria bacterium]|nr:NAD(P)-dependent oxidoreductase [Alphaproteobacteria bacterium]